MRSGGNHLYRRDSMPIGGESEASAQESEGKQVGAATKRTSADDVRIHAARFLVLALLSALLLFPSLRRPGLAGYDDAYFAHEGKEMVRTGEWGNVRLNGDPNFEHPPLFIWLEAASF